jgi:hypothetical protein
LIVFSIVSWFVISHNLSLLILFDHHIFIILRKHLFTKTCNFCINFLFIFHVYDPYSSTDLTLELKILILLPFDRLLEYHILFNIWNAFWAFAILVSVPPPLVMILLKYLNCSTFSI